MQYAAASGLVYRNTFHAVRTITHKEGLPGEHVLFTLLFLQKFMFLVHGIMSHL
jgi:hypothetical protein